MSEIKKGKIITVGTFDENGQPKDWCFDCMNDREIPVISIEEDGIRWAGYSLEELRAVASRQREVSEWLN